MNEDDIIGLKVVLLVFLMIMAFIIYYNMYNPLSGKEVKNSYIENIYVQNIKEEHSLNAEGGSSDNYYIGFSYEKEYLQIQCQECFKEFQNNNKVAISVFDIVMNHRNKDYGYYKFECVHGNKEYLNKNILN